MDRRRSDVDALTLITRMLRQSAARLGATVRSMNKPSKTSEPENIPPEELPKSEDELLESEAERKARESKKPLDPKKGSGDR